MLFILFGTMGKFGKTCREYFQNKHGFDYVEKLVYEPSTASTTSQSDKKFVSKEEVEKCDYRYQNNDRLIGFNFEQFADAVRGKTDCLLTLSAHKIELIRQLKAVYGDYVTVICTYIDGMELERMIADMGSLKAGEADVRIAMGKEIKRLYIEYRDDFDEMVVYGGEDSIFDKRSLERQFDFIVRKSRKKENKLNDETYIELPYVGKRPYVFASYAHADTKAVLPALEIMRRNGCRVWYDKGIPKGEDWTATIGDRIRECERLLVFTSKNSMNVESYVDSELAMAVFDKKKIVAVRLDDTPFMKKYDDVLSSIQYVDSRSEDYEKELLQSIPKETRVYKGKNLFKKLFGGK